MLYQQYGPLLLAICRRYSKTNIEAEDILQEGFIKIYQKIDTFKGSGSFEGWLKRVIVNTAINHYKSNLKHYFHENIDERNVIETSEPIEIEEMKSNKDELIKIIQQLPKGYQMVFNMYAIDGLTHQEIADELNISVNTSKTQLFKARKKLSEQLKEYYNNVK